MRNVALVVLDSVRKDVFDAFAPRLRAASAVSFSQCRAASSWSAPSHWSIFTGELPHQHGVHAESLDAAFDFGDLAHDATVISSLPGYNRLGVSANPYMNRTFGFDTHFDVFYDYSTGTTTTENLFTEGLSLQQFIRQTETNEPVRRYLEFIGKCLRHDKPLRSLSNGAWWWLGPILRGLPIPDLVDDGTRNVAETFATEAGSLQEPWFAFVNVMDAHTPLRNLYQFDQSLHSAPNDWSSAELSKWELNREGPVPEAYARNYRELYAAAVDYIDRVMVECLGRIQRDTDHETTFIIIADHGHNLGYPAEDGRFHHTRSLSEGVLHTPCEIVNPPPGCPTAIDGLVSHLDLPRLIEELATGDAFDERSLVRERAPAEIIGVVGNADSLWRSDFDPDDPDWNRMTRCVYDDGGTQKWQWDESGEHIRYDLDPTRPGWQEVSESNVDIPGPARELFDVGIQDFTQQVAERSQDLDFDEATQTQLEDLGYL